MNTIEAVKMCRGTDRQFRLPEHRKYENGPCYLTADCHFIREHWHETARQWIPSVRDLLRDDYEVEE